MDYKLSVQSLRSTLKEYEDLINGWYAAQKLVAREEVYLRDTLVERINRAGFVLVERWDEDNNRAVFGLELSPTSEGSQ